MTFDKENYDGLIKKVTKEFTDFMNNIAVKQKHKYESESDIMIDFLLCRTALLEQEIANLKTKEIRFK